MKDKKSDTKVKRVYLEQAKVGFSQVDEPKAFKKGDEPKYSLSLLLDKKQIGIVEQAIAEVCDGLPSHMEAMFLEEKIKQPSVWIVENISEYQKGEELISLKSIEKPHVEDVQLAPGSNIRLFGGDTVNVYFKVIYYGSVKKMGLKLLAVCRTKKGSFSDKSEFQAEIDTDWQKMNAKYKTDTDIETPF